MTPPLIFNKKEEETEKLTFRSTNTAKKKNKGIKVDTHTITKEEKGNINKTCFVKEQ